MGAGAESIFDMPLVFVDIETNGLSHVRGRIIEVAAIRVEHGRVTRIFNQLVDPGTELPTFITELTGIRSDDLRGASPFRHHAKELYDILQGAIMVAHNVRFDYSFLKQEFKRVGKTFLPKQLCTMKLSRTLYPFERSHKLESLIMRHGLSYQQRHRAYDDAAVLWQFLQHIEASFEPDTIHAAIKKQLRQPAIPKGLSQELVAGLPEAPGVYIFEDEAGKPLYIGKSINIKKRVLQHFGHDHDDSKEFKISQAIKHVSTLTTGGELEALLLESKLVKEMMPLYNRKLRRTNKILIARQELDEQGYVRVVLEEAAGVDPAHVSNILAVYARRSQAKSALESLQKLYGLCPKLLGFEKSKDACFLSQLGKCKGACAGRESAADYNNRLQVAFERQRIQDWPYQGAVVIQERFKDDTITAGIIVDQWCVIGEVSPEQSQQTQLAQQPKTFDLDSYKILQEFFTNKFSKLIIHPVSALG